MSPLQTATTIENQAGVLGYQVERQVAGTGTVYLQLSHPDCEDLLLRVADHPANEARYAARLNNEPDLDVDPGYQAAAVRWLTERIGVPVDSLPYLKRAATLERKAAEARQAEGRRRAAEARRREAESELLYEHASAGDRAKADHWRTLRGRDRKKYGYIHRFALQRAGARACPVAEEE